MGAGPGIIPPVIHTAQDGVFVHFHLGCGYMITIPKVALEHSLPYSIECWACEEQSPINAVLGPGRFGGKAAIDEFC